MKYSQELIDEVKILYENDSTMMKIAEDGNEFLGRYLDDGSSDEVDIDIVLNAETLKELKQFAKLIQRKRNLYNKWFDEYKIHLHNMVNENRVQ
jgi:hypothetical protein